MAFDTEITVFPHAPPHVRRARPVFGRMLLPPHFLNQLFQRYAGWRKPSQIQCDTQKIIKRWMNPTTRKGHIKKKISETKPEAKLGKMHNSHNRGKARKMSFRSAPPPPRKHCQAPGPRTVTGRSETRGQTSLVTGQT